jgi:hypothetical protein
MIAHRPLFTAEIRPRSMPGSPSTRPEWKQSAVMPALTIVQDERRLADPRSDGCGRRYLDMPPIAVYEVATFYGMYDTGAGGSAQDLCLQQCLLHAVRLRRSDRAPEHKYSASVSARPRPTADSPQGGGVPRRLRRRADDGRQDLPRESDPGGRPDSRRAGVGAWSRTTVCFRTLHLDVAPGILETYRSLGGYEAWEKILREKPRSGRHHRGDQALGLRGRGGAGFPTGLKWSFMPRTAPGRSTSCATRTRASRAPARTATSCATTRTR